MLKILTVIFTLVLCCYCLNENELVLEESRAKKKKNAARFWAMILFLIFSKVAVFKVVSVMMFMTIFQKLFALAGLVINYYMKSKGEKPPSTYGPPEYNTIGYSYGPPSSTGPEVENVFAGQEYGLPTLTEVGGNFNNWLFNKS